MESPIVQNQNETGQEFSLFYGVPEDIDLWMDLVCKIKWNFPGLETQKDIDEHKEDRS